MNRIVRLIAAAGLLLAIAFHPATSHACTATAQDVFTVGNKTVDSTCNYEKIQDAIDDATCPAGTKIILNTSGDYTSQHLTITNKNISLIGRAAAPHCNTPQAVCGMVIPCPVGSFDTISGSSGAVLTVRGTSNVTISHLIISGGNGNDGGGIDYSGQGTLQIDNSTVTDNHANNGAGIRFVGSGGEADLYLNANTFVSDNTAVHTGGGIRTDLQAKVHIDGDPIWINGNKAGDYGGGIAVVGGAYAHVGSPGYLFGGVFYNNTAQYGGGIAIIGESTGDAAVDLFAIDPARPVRVGTNRATHAGGGVYLNAYASMQGNGAVVSKVGTLQMQGAHVDDNSAPEGSGIYADTYSSDLFEFPYGTYVYLYSGASCAVGAECNSVSDNHAVMLDNMGHDVPTLGSAILIQTDGVFKSQNLAMRGNDGAHAIRVADSLHDTFQSLTCLIADNPVTQELITLGNAAATFDQCTIAGNDIGGASVFNAATGFTLTNSIVEQGALPTVHYIGSGTGLTVNYLLQDIAAPAFSFGATNIFGADAAFIDPANGDYHLRRESPAIDVAPAVAGDDRDLDYRLRDQDMSSKSDTDGVRDLGAYERQARYCGAGDTVFCDGFEL
jgi:hypothetical protein